MADALPVDPVKFVVAALYSDRVAFDQACARLEATRGAIDFTGEERDFDVTDYYKREMGPELFRRIVAFETLIPPDALSSRKHESNRIESELAIDHRRRVNLDVGYLDHHKLVLASFKPAGQKLYVGDGVWADMMCRYRSGGFECFAWTFPDFRDGRYEAELLAIREVYMKQIRG